MKKIFLIVFVLVSSFSFAQTAKVDSVQIAKQEAEAQKFVNDLVKETTIKDLQEWAFKNTTAEQYGFFMSVYNAFIQRRYLEQAQKRK